MSPTRVNDARKNFTGSAANIARLMLAIAWTASWGFLRFLNSCLESLDWPIVGLWRLAFLWGRHASPKPMICTRCGWCGPRRWTRHAYRADGCGDVEAVDECVRCGDDESLRQLGTLASLRARATDRREGRNGVS